MILLVSAAMIAGLGSKRATVWIADIIRGYSSE